LNTNVILSSLVTFFSLSAIASEPSFHYIEGSYIKSSPLKNEKKGFKGLQLKEQFEINNDFFGIIQFKYLKNEKNLSNQQTQDERKKSYGFGLGYKNMIFDNVAFFTHIDYIQESGQTLYITPNQRRHLNPKVNKRGRGYQIGLGFKWALPYAFEISSELAYRDLGKLTKKQAQRDPLTGKYVIDDKTKHYIYVQSKTQKQSSKLFKLGINYKIKAPISLYLSAEHNFDYANDKDKQNDHTDYSLGLRYSF
jgi:hypothetical protein